MAYRPGLYSATSLPHYQYFFSSHLVGIFNDAHLMIPFQRSEFILIILDIS